MELMKLGGCNPTNHDKVTFFKHINMGLQFVNVFKSSRFGGFNLIKEGKKWV